MDSVDELIVNVALGYNGRKDYYAGRNIEKEMEAIARGEEKVIKTNKRLANSQREVQKSGFALGKSLRFIAAYLATDKLIKYADEWTNIKSTLDLVTQSDKERLDVQEKLFNIAQKTRQDVSGTVDLFSKITRNAESLNLTQEKRLQLTEAINKALIIGGGSSASNQAALLQFGQALSMGNLRGQELNSVLAQSPRLAQMIAEGMGVKTSDLKNMGAKGELTSEKVISAIINQSQKVNTEFLKMGATIGQAATVFNNSFGKFVNELNEVTGASRILANTIILLADNIKLLAKIVIPALLLRSKLLRTALLNGGVAMRYMEMRANKLSLSLKKGSAGAWAMGKAFLKLEAIFWLFEQIKKFINGEDNIFVMVASLFVNLEKWLTDGLNSMPEKLKVGVDGALKGMYDLLGDIFSGIFGYFGDLWRTITGEKPMFLDSEFKRANEKEREKSKTPTTFEEIVPPNTQTMTLFPTSTTNSTSHNANITYNNNITVNEARQGMTYVNNTLQQQTKLANEALGFTPIGGY